MSSSAGPQRETEVLRLQVDTFYQVNRFISSIDNLEDLLTLIMQEAEAAVEAEASCIALYDPEDNRLHIKFASGEESESVRHLSQAIEQGILGAAASTNTFVLVEDAQNDPRWYPSYTPLSVSNGSRPVESPSVSMGTPILSSRLRCRFASGVSSAYCT